MRLPAQRRRRRHGFTLIEVLLVLAILVILGSLVGVSIITAQSSANRRAARTQINLLNEAITWYQTDVGQLPPDLNALLYPPSNLASPMKWQGPYLEKQSIPLDPWGNQYEYQPTTDEFNRQMAVISSYGPDMQKGTEDDITTLDDQQQQQ